MIREFGSFTRTGLLADLERSAEIWWGTISISILLIMTGEGGGEGGLTMVWIFFSSSFL